MVRQTDNENMLFHYMFIIFARKMFIDIEPSRGPLSTLRPNFQLILQRNEIRNHFLDVHASGHKASADRCFCVIHTLSVTEIIWVDTLRTLTPSRARSGFAGHSSVPSMVVELAVLPAGSRPSEPSTRHT